MSADNYTAMSYIATSRSRKKDCFLLHAGNQADCRFYHYSLLSVGYRQFTLRKFLYFYQLIQLGYMKKPVLSIIILLLSLHTFSQKVYDFDATCRSAYSDILKLKIKTGQELVAKARQQNPNNLIPELLQGYIDFFVLFFNEDPAEFAVRKDNFDKRLDAFDGGPDNSPFYRYCKALTYIQRDRKSVV